MVFVLKRHFYVNSVMFKPFDFRYLLNCYLTKTNIYLLSKSEMFCWSFIIQTMTTNTVDGFINQQDTCLC